MDAVTIEALTALQNLQSPAIFAHDVGLTYKVVIAIEMIALVTSAFVIGIQSFARGKILDWYNMGVPTAIVTAFVSLGVIPVVMQLHEADDRKYVEVQDNYRAVTATACGTALEAISGGQVTILTSKATKLLETRCGVVAFMAAANAPTSRVDFTASALASAAPLDL